MLALVLAAALDAESLMARVATIADATMKIREERQLTYRKTLVKDKETREWRGWWDDQGHHYDQLVRLNGAATIKDAEPSTDLNLSEIMRTRFTFAMADPAEAVCPTADRSPSLEGRRCHVVLFSLKPTEERAHAPKLADPKAELILDHLKGKLYVDMEHLFIVHIEGREIGSFGHPNGITTIKKIDLDYHQELFKGIPVLTQSRIDVRYTSLAIFAGTDKTRYTYDEYLFAYPPPIPPTPMPQPSPTP